MFCKTKTAQDTSQCHLCQLTNPVFLTQNCSMDPAGCEDPAHTDPNTQEMYILRSPDLKWQPKEGMGFIIVGLWGCHNSAVPLCLVP